MNTFVPAENSEPAATFFKMRKALKIVLGFCCFAAATSTLTLALLLTVNSMNYFRLGPIMVLMLGFAVLLLSIPVALIYAGVITINKRNKSCHRRTIIWVTAIGLACCSSSAIAFNCLRNHSMTAAEMSITALREVGNVTSDPLRGGDNPWKNGAWRRPSGQ